MTETYVIDGQEYTSIYDGKFAWVQDGKLMGGVDWNGQEYRIGDRVLYCIGAGQGQMMAYGVVKNIVLKEMYPGIEGYEGYAHFKVQVLTERTSGNWDNGKRSRPAFVNPMNITYIPSRMQSLLDFGKSWAEREGRVDNWRTQ